VEPVRVALSLSILVTITAALAQQNPTLAGDPLAGAVPETNPFGTDADIQQGAGLFQTHCSYCHGVRGEGGRGADLTAGEYRMGGSDRDLFKTVRMGVPGSEMPSFRISDDEVWKVVAYVKRLGSQGLLEKASGDAAAGKALYARNGCSACHKIGDQGIDLGPPLTGVGRRRGVAFLEESLVKPDAVVANGFRAVQVVLKSGQTITGIRLNEDDLSVQLREASGNLRSILKGSVREIRRDKPSLMPAYGGRLSRTELADLVAYLNSLKGEQ
jgi:putative heme-binding domain-containing protein